MMRLVLPRSNLFQTRASRTTALHACTTDTAARKPSAVIRNPHRRSSPTLAPNTPETRDAFRAELAKFLQNISGDTDFTLAVTEDPRRRVGAVVQLAKPLESDLEMRPVGV